MEDSMKTKSFKESEEVGLRRGPWTLEEDTLLTNYILHNGEGRWNLVAKSAGLKRNGKSCRLRWLNYLKPDIRRGNLTPQEQLLILELHSKWGNRWSKIAQYLPGRTDNEIKNYWNTRTKRRQRAGLPLYPHEIQHRGIGNDDEFEFSSFQFPNQDHPNHQNLIQYTNSSNNSSSSSSFSSSSSQPPKELCLNPLISTNPGLNQIPNMFSPYNNSFENDNNQFGFSLPFSSSSSSNELCNPDQLLELMSENLDTNVISKKDIDATSLIRDHETIPSYFSLGLDTTVLELPSNQTPTQSCTSNIMLDNNVHLDSPAGNSGLLDALLEESRALSRGGIFRDARVSSSGLCEDQDKRVKMDFENRLIDHLSSSHQSSFESNSNLYEKHNDATMLKATVDDDDDDMLKSLLNSFPSTTPLPDWYQTTEILKEASPSGILIGHHQGNNRVEPHKPPPSSNVDPMASLGSSSYWGNIPRIC